ncbi:hypothetical protein HDU76_009134, partial [Blyttiomyces sp. JEL0837]
LCKQFAWNNDEFDSTHIVHESPTESIVVTNVVYYRTLLRTCRELKRAAEVFLRPKVSTSNSPNASSTSIASQVSGSSSPHLSDAYDIMLCYEWDSGKDLILKIESLYNAIRRGMNAKVELPQTIEPFDALTKWLRPVDFSNGLAKFKTDYAPETRTWAVNDVHSWLKEGLNPFLWLNGGASLGKSIIAYLVSQNLPVGFVLGSAFFCKYDDINKNNSERIVATIAFNLASKLPTYREFLAKGMETDAKKVADGEPLILSKLSISFKELIINRPHDIQPPASHLVIIIDALDELPSWIRVFTTSRPEMDIFDVLDDVNCAVLSPQDDNNIQDIQSIYDAEDTAFELYAMVFGVVLTAREQLHQDSIAKLLALSVPEVGGTILRVQSILTVTNGTVNVLHKSLKDVLSSMDRCKNPLFYINTNAFEYFEFNQLSSPIPNSFGNLDTLLYVDFAHNLITAIPNTSGGLKRRQS